MKTFHITESTDRKYIGSTIQFDQSSLSEIDMGDFVFRPERFLVLNEGTLRVFNSNYILEITTHNNENN